jgi:hypothetical protein
MATPRTTDRPTLRALCRTIRAVARRLPAAAADAIAAAHPQTWALVNLTVNRYANPTEAARARLEELFAAVDAARVDHLRLWGPGDVVAWTMIDGCTMTGTVKDRCTNGLLTLVRPDGGWAAMMAGAARRATPADKALALAFYTTPGYRTPDAVAATAARQAGYAITAPAPGR